MEMLRAHPHIGFIFSFFVSFLESLPIIGTIVPGSVTMTGVGTLIGSKALPMVTTLAFATVGAFIGDCIGYYLGRRYGEACLDFWPFNKHPEWLTKGEVFFERHGGKSIIIGRFVGPIRSTIPMIAGILRLSPMRFCLAAIPSALLWALAYTVPGILIGALALALPPHAAAKFIVIALITIVLLMTLVWGLMRFGGWLITKADQLLYSCWSRSREITLDHRQLGLWLIALVSALIFASDWSVLLYTPHAIGMNTALFSFLQSLHTPWLDRCMATFTALGNKVLLIPLCMIIALWLWCNENKRAATGMVLGLIAIAALVGITKHVYYHPRPTGFLSPPPSSSFPSGHTALTVFSLGLLAYIARVKQSVTTRRVILILAILTALGVTTSRLYLGAHWLTDVIGSWSLAACVLSITIALTRKKPLPQCSSRSNIIIALILVIPWAIASVRTNATTLRYFTPVWPTTQMNIAQWWQAPHNYLPVYRKNRFGHVIMPFNIQWSSTTKQITHRLTTNGWKIVTIKKNITRLIARLSHNKQSHALSLLPPLYQQKHPAMIFMRDDTNGGEIILRLWPANVDATLWHHPLWIGTLMQRDDKTLTLNVLSVLKPSLNGLKQHITTISRRIQPKRIKPLHWDGAVLLIK